VDGSGDAILANLGKVNATTWKDDSGNVYTSGTIIAGTLTVSKQNPELSNTPNIETGNFSSNGGQIAINCSMFVNLSTGLISSTCSLPEPTPDITLKLYDISSGSSLVFQQTFSGNYSCFADAESGQVGKSYNATGTFTYFDNDNDTSVRNYRLEAVVGEIPISTRNQRLSILTQEA
jgi:hypothetical protein